MPTAITHDPVVTFPASSTNTALVRWSGTGGNTLLDSTLIVGATTMGLAADTDLVTFGNGTLTVAGTVSATLIAGAAVKDEDNMASDSATHLSSQQSIKAYVDANAGFNGNLTGGQLTFPASQNAAGGANVLDDYEEGSWTPNVTFGGGSTGVTYAWTRYGYYTKIGNLVAIWARLELSSKGSSTGHLQITGLPFTPTATISVIPSGYLSNITFSGPLHAIVDQGTQIIDFYEMNSGSGSSTVTNGDLTNTSAIGLQGIYAIV